MELEKFPEFFAELCGVLNFPCKWERNSFELSKEFLGLPTNHEKVFQITDEKANETFSKRYQEKKPNDKRHEQAHFAPERRRKTFLLIKSHLSFIRFLSAKRKIIQSKWDDITRRLMHLFSRLMIIKLNGFLFIPSLPTPSRTNSYLLGPCKLLVFRLSRTLRRSLSFEPNLIMRQFGVV